MFLKAKNVEGNQVLIAVADISAVIANDVGTAISMRNGDVHNTVLGLQAVGNRLVDLGATVA